MQTTGDQRRPISRDSRRSVDDYFVPWFQWFDDFARHWDQGDHVTIIGQTKSGKTTLARELLSLRRTVVGVATKPRDELLKQFPGYKIVRTLPLPPIEIHPRVMFWPRSEKLTDLPEQREQIRQMLAQQYRQGGDAIYIDETFHVSEKMRLGPLLELIWTVGRTNKSTVVASAQRPFHIPLVAYSQAKHLFFFRAHDPVDVRRAAGFAGVNRANMQRVVNALPPHYFAHMDTFTGEIEVSIVETNP